MTGLNRLISTMDEAAIRTFWNANPCGEHQVGAMNADYDDFFRRYDTFRYATQGHILRRLDAINWRGKRVLEIGLEQGTDSEQLIRRGAMWSGLDLTEESIDRVRTRLALRKLPFDELKCGSVLCMPFESNSFDIVYSHGVLHHVPDIDTAQREIARVLKPGGDLIMMVYAKASLNYVLSISLLRRIGLLALFLSGAEWNGIYGEHLRTARRMGILRYLLMSNFIHRNTDGPLNPYSRVYTLRDVRTGFRSFRVTRCYKEFMHAPPLPVARFPGHSVMGWHLWVQLSVVPDLDPTEKNAAAKH